MWLNLSHRSLSYPKATSLTRANVDDLASLRNNLPQHRTNHDLSTTLPITFPYVSAAPSHAEVTVGKMSAMFSQNPLMNGPNYSFSDTPRTNNGELREHSFNP